MTAIDDSWLLRAWEQADPVPQAARGAVFVCAAGLCRNLDAALDLPVTELTGLLARLYARSFGTSADAVLDCAGCGATLDLRVPVDELARSVDTAPGRDGDRPPGALSVEVDVPSGRRLRVRLPTSRDLLEVRDEADPEAALLHRCVTGAGGRGDPLGGDESSADGISPDDLGADERSVDERSVDERSVDERSVDERGVDELRVDGPDAAAIDAALTRLAGPALATVDARCPECGAVVSADVDLAAFMWAAIDRDAPTLLAEIADIAAEFGWSESEILGLPAARRWGYLTLIRGDGP